MAKQATTAYYEGGVTEIRQVGVRLSDGATFKRFKERHPRFGYRWSAWGRQALVLDPANLPATVDSGFYELRRRDGTPYSGTVRLPKG